MTDEQINKSIGTKILLKRTEKNYTRETVADLADISSSFLYEIETGRKGFTVAVLYRIAMALETDVVYFLNDDEKEMENKLLYIIRKSQSVNLSSVVELLKAIQAIVKK